MCTEKSIAEIEPRDVGKLCMQCGACCFMLKAEVRSEEVDALLEGNVNRNRLLVEEDGKYFLKFPCMYLHGRPLSYVRCLAYHKFRPEVCVTYLCRIAVKYKLHQITMEEALYELRSAFMTRQPWMFNWGVDGKADSTLLTMLNLNTLAQRLKTYNVPQDYIPLMVASTITPTWEFKSNVSKVLFSMLLQLANKGDFDIRLFVPQEKLDTMSESDKVVATQVAEMVMEKVMQHFHVTVDSEKEEKNDKK